MKGAPMYKVICPIDNEIKWTTKDRAEAVAHGKKYQALVFKGKQLIMDFSKGAAQ